MSSIIHQTGSVRPLSLQEREQPQLYRELFPYTSICRTTFDEVLLAPRPAEQMRITDTTFRDGQQARPPYTVKQVAKMFDFLHRMGGKTGLITASEFFLYSAKDRKCIDVCRARGYRFPRVTAWIRANKEDLKLARDMEFDETGMLTSVSDYHIYLKLGKTRQQAMDMYLDLARQALEWGIIPRCHFEDVTRADIYGFCLPFAQKLMELSQQSGMPVKIRLCDTMGYGVPYPGAALPRSVQRIVRAFTDEAGVPGEWLEWHGHNDFHKVLVNGVTAWLNGCGAVNSTLFGFGERTGNTPLEALIIEYISLTGDDAAADTTILSEVAEFFEKELHYNIPYNYPFVGRDWPRTKRSTTSSTPTTCWAVPCPSSSPTRPAVPGWPTGSTSTSSCPRASRSPRSTPPWARSTRLSWPSTTPAAPRTCRTTRWPPWCSATCRNCSRPSSTT